MGVTTRPAANNGTSSITPTGGVPPLHPLDEDMLREGRKGGRERERGGGKERGGGRKKREGRRNKKRRGKERRRRNEERERERGGRDTNKTMEN